LCICLLIEVTFSRQTLILLDLGRERSSSWRNFHIGSRVPPPTTTIPPAHSADPFSQPPHPGGRRSLTAATVEPGPPLDEGRQSSAMSQRGRPLVDRQRLAGELQVDVLPDGRGNAVPPWDDEGVEDGARVLRREGGTDEHRGGEGQREGGEGGEGGHGPVREMATDVQDDRITCAILASPRSSGSTGSTRTCALNEREPEWAAVTAWPSGLSHAIGIQ